MYIQPFIFQTISPFYKPLNSDAPSNLLSELNHKHTRSLTNHQHTRSHVVNLPLHSLSLRRLQLQIAAVTNQITNVHQLLLEIHWNNWIPSSRRLFSFVKTDHRSHHLQYTFSPNCPLHNPLLPTRPKGFSKSAKQIYKFFSFLRYSCIQLKIHKTPTVPLPGNLT